MLYKECLVETKNVWGDVRRAILPPPKETVKNAIFVPETYSNWGVFDASGKVVNAASGWHGPVRRQVYPPVTAINVNDFDASPDYMDGHYYYCGLVLPHFGHCLLTTFSRYWMVAGGVKPSGKIIYHGMNPFTLPFLAFWLQKCGFLPRDFVEIKKLTRFEKLTCIGASFDELSRVHDVFGTLCRRVGSSAMEDSDHYIYKNPVYLSKSKIKSGVGTVVNEYDIESLMTGLGVSVVYPEELSIPNQINIFSNSPVIMGMSGSSFHSSLFSGSKTRMAVMTYQNVIHSNNLLIDKISKNKSIYLTPKLEPVAVPDGFQLGYKFLDVDYTAKSLLEWAQSI